jgi:L-rhamnose-H+ transport protein
MTAIVGVILIMFGGLASGAFYLPLKYVKNWSWETGWLIQGLSAWVLAPWIIALITVPSLFSIIGQSPSNSIWFPILFGFGWGIGGLTWGLSIRYLGIGLGNALPLGLTSALSTIISPLVPILTGQTSTPNGLGFAVSNRLAEMFAGTQGKLILASIILSLLGMGLTGWAASLKEKDLNKGNGTKDFNLKKGLLVALVAGVMSACFSFGESSGKAMADITASINPGTIWKYNGVYAVLLIGGFGFNFIYCILLSFRNKSFSDYMRKDSPLTRNYLFAALAGLIWFLQFVFKGMGTTQIPAELGFIAWTILFSCVLVFSNLIGIIAKEWQGVTKKTIATLVAGILVLILAVALVGIASKFVV